MDELSGTLNTLVVPASANTTRKAKTNRTTIANIDIVEREIVLLIQKDSELNYGQTFLAR